MNQNIHVSHEASLNFANELLHPNQELLKVRDAYLNRISSINTIKNGDRYEVEIPELDLGFLNLESKKEMEMSFTVKISNSIKEDLYSLILKSMEELTYSNINVDMSHGSCLRKTVIVTLPNKARVIDSITIDLKDDPNGQAA